MFVLDQIKAFADTGRTALRNRGDSLSFAELDIRSEAFAAWLLGQYGGDRTPVVIYGHKQTDFLPCIYGSLKAGRAYVPVDVTTPPERVGEIIGDVAPRVVIDFSGELHCDAAVLRQGALTQILHSPPAEDVPHSTWVKGRDTAYILFTSGSTGKPKGVPITVNNLASFYKGLRPYMGGEESGVILNQVSYSFDVSGCSLYTGLAMGKTLFTVDKEMVENLGALLEALGDSQLSTWVSTPSFAEVCAQSKRFTAELLPELGCFLFCGEVLTHKLCDTLAARFPAAGVLNTYGPTEATVLVTAAWITEEMRRDAGSIPIGYPLEGVELRIVDEKGGALTGDGESGELLILGDSVGPGYLRRPDLTAARFFTDAATGRRGYRTGDTCCRKDGLYYYQGRIDNQLKLGGYRIELEDIENNLARLDNVSRAAVVPVWENERVQYLAAFLLLDQEDGLTPLKRSIQLKKQAGEILPAYMIPRKLVAVEGFPLTQSGKIDRKALAAQLQGAEKR